MRLERRVRPPNHGSGERGARAAGTAARAPVSKGVWNGYAKLEQTVDAQDLAALEAAFCPVERGAMLGAAHALVQYFVQTAPPLATMQGVAYPTDLECVVSRQLDELGAMVGRVDDAD